MDRRRIAPIVAASAIGIIILLLILWPSRGSTRNPRGPEFPVELAEAIRDGVAMTREARRDAMDGMVSAQRWRLLAIVIGVCVPIVVAYLALRVAATKDPDEADVMARMIEESRILAKHSLPHVDHRKLKEQKSLSEGESASEDNPSEETSNEAPDDG